ncbi:N-acetylmuramoyl-L-alanine amidase [Mesobacillus subterraneus]|uniref:N-acetylmuramoyl-L-alanine amidase family protein n=1 Tax=Mesobacillus subterraneus TaxID=285983 RepID=UPI001CFD53AC|nr:N-acetylmuramoyl-L-alanine amidase [Mesobacillus subterraneus]WLR54825.1 N-acetylmuramoyl-L-alanine amidase [Mesobacillus subterraneus]
MNEELHNDFGHGKNTYPPSKGVPGLPEFEFNSAVGRETKRLLEGIMTTYEAQPFNGNDVPLRTRTNFYNARYARNKKAIGISDHANANGKKSVRGFGVFYWHSSSEAKKLAQIILDEYKKEFPDREKYPIWGDGLFASEPGEWTDLHMCRETKGIFVLVEWEFMTNPESYKLLKSDDYRKRCALVKARSACRWYGIPFDKPAAKPAAKPAPKPKEEDDMLEKAIVVFGMDDFPAAKRLAKKIKAPIYVRDGLPAGRLAKEVYVVGGDEKGLKGDKFVILSGSDLFETSNAVGEFLKK